MRSKLQRSEEVKSIITSQLTSKLIAFKNVVERFDVAILFIVIVALYIAGSPVKGRDTYAKEIDKELVSEAEPSAVDFAEESNKRLCHEMAKSLVKHSEGFKPTWYKCPGGKLTIGYGFTHMKWRGKMTRSEADRIFDDKYEETRKAVDELVTRKIKESRKAALTSFAYNVGLNAFKESQLLKYVNSGRITKAKKEFKKWIYVKSSEGAVKLEGLESRREQEIKLWDLELS
jgi:GH24 family phage-related lysozyme (muramidase)